MTNWFLRLEILLSLRLNGWRAGDHQIPLKHGNAMMKETIEMRLPGDGLGNSLLGWAPEYTAALAEPLDIGTFF